MKGERPRLILKAVSCRCQRLS